MTGCNICNSDEINKLLIMKQNDVEYLAFVGGNSKFPKDNHAKYCPECGRKLESNRNDMLNYEKLFDLLCRFHGASNEIDIAYCTMLNDSQSDLSGSRYDELMDTFIEVEEYIQQHLKSQID